MSAYYDKAKYVLTIAAEGNISRAAEKLYVSQSTLTMYLNRVEEEFGTPLFNRSARPITPTQAGLLYINDLMAVQRMEQSFFANLRHLRNPNETLNIGVGPIRSNIYMPRLLARLREAYSNISVNLTELSDDNLPSGLLQGKHDVIFGCFDPAEILAAQVVEIGTECVGIIAPKSYQLSGGVATSPESPAAITGQRLKHLPVVTSGPGSDLHDVIVDILNRWGAEPSSIITTQAATTAIGLVAEGLGYAFVEYPFLRGVQPSLLEQLDYLAVEEDRLPDKRVVACYSKNSIKESVIKDAIEFFRGIFHNMPPK